MIKNDLIIEIRIMLSHLTEAQLKHLNNTIKRMVVLNKKEGKKQ